MKRFSLLVFLFTLVLSSFSQGVFNEIYTGDTSFYNLPLNGLAVDYQNSIYGVYLEVNGGYRGYVIKKYSSNGVELASYKRPSSSLLFSGSARPILFHNSTNQLLHGYSYSNDSLICIERLNQGLELVSDNCFNCGAESRFYSMELLSDSLLFVTCTAKEEFSPVDSDAYLMLLNIETNEIVWKRNLGVENLSENIPGVAVYQDRALIAYRDEGFNMHALIYHKQGFPMVEKVFPELNTIHWTKNQKNGNDIYAIANIGSIFTDDGVTVLRLNSVDLTIEDSATYLAEKRAYAGNSYFHNGFLYTPGFTNSADSSFLLITDAYTGDSLDIKWYNKLLDFKESILIDIERSADDQIILGGQVADGSPIPTICPWLIKTDQYGCASELCLDVAEVVGEENAWRIYPNPTIHSDYASVELSMPLAELSHPELQVFNSSGVLMHTISIKQKEFQLQKPAHSGFYVVVLKAENKVIEIQKWVIL